MAGTEKGTGQFCIDGNRDRSNNFTLDGTDNSDPPQQLGAEPGRDFLAPATLLPIDAIQVFNLES